MKTAVFVALGLLLLSFLGAWLISRIEYRITDRDVRVVLFGLRLRRVRLGDILSVSKRRGDGWAENWWSTLRPTHRTLVIRRRRGLFRNFIITPRNRYVFKADLERLLAAVNPSAVSVGGEASDAADDPDTL